MKLKYKQILNSIQSLNELINKEMPYKTALYISRNVSELNKKLDDYQEERYNLEQKYFEKDENGNYVITETEGYKIKDGMADQFREDLNVLNEFEVEVEINYLTSDMFYDVSIKPSQLLHIDFMIKDE